MPITNSFTCSNGHTFDAVAKIRARCPECGVMAKRPFGNQTKPKPAEPVVTETPKPVEHTPTSGPIVLRQGRHTMAARKVTKPTHTTKTRPAPKAPVRKTAVEKPRVVSGGVVKMRKAAATTPTVTRLPKKTSVSKVASTIGGRNKSYMQRVIDKFGL